MLLLKQTLQAVSIIASIDKPELAYFSDGAGYAVNRKAAVMLSPMTDDRKKATPMQDTGNFSFAVSADALRSVIKLIPADKMFKGLLECVDVEIKDHSASWASSDGRRKHNIRCAISAYNKNLVNDIRAIWWKKWNESQPASISALNVLRINNLFEAVKAAGCSSSGEEPIWLRCCNDGSVLLRAVNYSTHQRVLGMCTAYDADEGQMPEWLSWEKYTEKKVLKWKREK